MKSLPILFGPVLLVALVGCGSSFPDDPQAHMPTSLVIRDAVEAGARGAAEAAPVLSEPVGWATLRGAFKVNGAPPPGVPLTDAVTHPDKAICAPGGQAPLSQDVLVGPGGGLSGVAVYLNMRDFPIDDPKWLHASYQSLRGQEAVLDQKYCVFLPHVLGMWTAQSLKVLNSDPIGHNTKIDTKGRATPFNQLLAANGSTTYTPGGEEAAPAPVSCSIHPWMKAYLLPRDNPYFAVTNDQGEFEIANLPAGVELEFRVWQPRLGFVEGAGQMNGQTQKISKGRTKLTLNDGETRELNVALEAAQFQK